MILKKSNTALVTLILLIAYFPSIAKAGLIQSDYLTTGDNLTVRDQSTGLVWLDLSLTRFMSYSQASKSFVGYRAATNTEVETLFINFFGVNDSNKTGRVYSCIKYCSPYKSNELMLQFQELFGNSGFTKNDLTKSIGLYIDEDSKLTIAGVENGSGINARYNAIYGHEWYNGSNYGGYINSIPSQYGSYLVKDNINIPEPTSFILFALSLISLILHRPNKLTFKLNTQTM